MVRKGFSSSQKIEILTRQNYKCNNCGDKFNEKRYPHFDHIDQRSANNSISNGQAMCGNCHDVKSRDENRNRPLKSKKNTPQKEEKFDVADFLNNERLRRQG